ncbi:MAG: sensory histidine kinase AtoS [Methanoregula sp. PtaU1.Bin051]|nr:MAG: sensory histidine kinase AtoS [Methanoregula sp. PtaU1.Bin051]
MPMESRLLLFDTAIGLSVIASIGATIFSLTHGITDIYPFLYFLPIILFVTVHPDRGVIFSLLLASVYIFLVYFFGMSNPQLVAVSTAWFVILVTIGVVTSSFAKGLHAEERKFQKIFSNSQAGTLTFDHQTQQIREVNDKFARMLRYERDDLLGKVLLEILPDSAEWKRFIGQIRSGIMTGDVELPFRTRDGTMRQFLITATPLPDNTVICSAIDITERKLAETVIQKAKAELDERIRQRTEELIQQNEVLRTEIYERRQSEEVIQLINRKLNTLASITRHDLLNQITALTMYLNLAQEITDDPEVKEILGKIEQNIKIIHKQIRFTREYQNIGVLAPQWQDVRSVIGNAVSYLHPENVEIGIEISGVEIFADMLLEKVFYNIIDNALRHGGDIKRIRFSCQKEMDNLLIICEDDGTGIPQNVKEKIFRREYYQNTGYGLFLVAEILSLTGITIRETGMKGKGARFEILVPAGKFRIKKSHPADK